MARVQKTTCLKVFIIALGESFKPELLEGVK